MGRLKLRLIDAVWLLALAVYILAGMMLASFHGDESIHIYTSRDYVTAFIDHNPTSLMVSPPYYIDDDPWLRILNGSVDRYTIGLSLHLAGLTDAMQLPRPGWDWGLDYDRDVATGHLPSEVMLRAARIPSTLFLIMSAFAMYGIGWQFGGRFLAYFISGLYTLNPIILLNGRRAMMEGSLLGFGLLTIWLAILISRGRTRWYWWVLLTLSAGMSLVSKQTGVIYIGGALGWIGLAAITKWISGRMQKPVPSVPISSVAATILKLIASGIATIAIWLALSPAMWNDPVARLGDLISQRQMLIDIQVAGDPNAPTSIVRRLEDMVTQPFLTPPQHFEVAFWANAKDITAEIERYMASPLSGLQFGLLGIPLTLLAGWGLIVVVREWKSWQVGLLVWLGVNIAAALVNPLPWQRYALPVIPVLTILAGVGLLSLFRRIQATRLKST